MKQKVKLAIILGAEFLAIAIVLLLIFFSTKKQYTITFDLDGGTLISGSLVQSVTQGHNATPPSAVKEGHYLRGWSGNYRGVTSDERVTAIWEYETTPGIEYSTKAGATYTEISGCFRSISGKLYIGAYHNDLIVYGIKTGAFANCTRVTDIYLLDGIITIGERAFAGCTSLEAIELPDTATVIGDSAFEGCESLKTVVLPRALETLGDNAFIGCDSLETVYIPDTVTGIGENAFLGCENLKNVIFYSEDEVDTNALGDAENDSDGDDVGDESTDERVLPPLTVGASAFAACLRLEAVEFPNGLIRIEDSAFKGCPSLKEVILGKSLQYIGEEAFLGCVSLEVCDLTDEITHIGRAAFKDCRALTRASIPAGVVTVEESLFSGCTSLVGVTLKSGTVTVRRGAFKGCSGLEYAVIPRSVTVIETEAFDSDTLTVYLERGSNEPQPVGYAPAWCHSETHFIFDYSGEEIVTDPKPENITE